MVDWTRADGWDIEDGPAHINQPGMTTHFWLTAQTVGGRAQYTVNYKEHEMDDAWTTCTPLIERGQGDFRWTQNTLEPWDPQTQGYAYDKAISIVLQAANSNTLRLEGEITIDGEKELVILLVAEGAVKSPNGNEALMVILTSAHFVPTSVAKLYGLQKDQDGTAHAKPH